MFNVCRKSLPNIKTLIKKKSAENSTEKPYESVTLKSGLSNLGSKIKSSLHNSVQIKKK
jgi:hypothetical protein